MEIADRVLTVLRHPAIRLLLFALALVLLAIGWGVGPRVSAADWPFLARNHENFQRLAAVPAVLWGFLESVRATLEHGQAVRTADVQAQFDEILVELESACADRGQASRTYQCGITVWKLQKLTRAERRTGETRPRLKAVAIRPVRYKRNTSGLRWRLGMGVIGTALQDNTRLAIDVDAAWAPLRGCTKDEWDAQPDDVRQGLTHEEFRTAVAGTPGSADPAGQFVLAVPVWRGSKPVGVVALDTPPEMGGPARDSRVADLLYAVGTYVLVR